MSNGTHRLVANPRTTTPEGFVLLSVEGGDPKTETFAWTATEGNFFNPSKAALGTANHAIVYWQAMRVAGPVTVSVDITPNSGVGVTTLSTDVEVTGNPIPEAVLGALDSGVAALREPIRLEPQIGVPSDDQALWVAIRNGARNIAFEPYAGFIDRVLCGDDPVAYGTEQHLRNRRDRLPNPLHGVDAFQLLKTATEAFLLVNCGVYIRRGTYDAAEEASRIRNRPARELSFDAIRGVLRQYLGGGQRLPYIDRILRALSAGGPISSPYCVGVLDRSLAGPCLLELVWSYWHEEGMLVQSINAVSLRFQNRRSAGGRDPLSPLEIDPLRPLSNLMWGYIQDEPHRLTVSRRAYEYDHHYGMRLIGRAVGSLRPADSRSKFLQAFHTVLNRAATFFQEAADATVTPDGFPMLNALKETHLVLAEGAHNQFRDLPWTARVEMLIQQWLLARPEMREFLRGRAMVPYREPWMGQVDTMKKLQRWTDTGITHFNDLAVFGEQIVLSIRYGDWVDVNDENQARNWAQYWRPEIQGYLHAYRAATGEDLSNPDYVDATQPSMHLRRRSGRKTRA